jgi:perosamine synthetase
MLCRHCHNTLNHVFVDLGSSPPSNAYLTADDLKKPEKWFPLRVLVCENCWLVQTEDFAQADELFDANYAYFSSYSTSWMKHAENYVSEMIQRFQLGAESHVVEVASNDGYLLQYVQEGGIPCIGIEPTASTAAAARDRGIHVIEQFFGVTLARQLVGQGKEADLIVANNVLAHVPDINDFVAGFAELLRPQGVATFEFPHLLQLVQQNQFDTIYHEHFSYLSLTTVNTIFNANGLLVFDLEELPTHGGSLRVYAQRKDSGVQRATMNVAELLERETAAGMSNLRFYEGFQAKAEKIKNDFLEFLLAAKRDGRRVAAYGAAAKGNTLLNFAGVKSDLLEFVVDRNPAKQGKFLPGSRVPIAGEEFLRSTKPDDIVVLPWNLSEEVRHQLGYAGAWNARHIAAVPSLTVSSFQSYNRPSSSVTASSEKPRIPYTKPSITELEVAYAIDAARNGWGERCYEYITRFEDAFRKHLGVKHAIATSSCTGALHMGMAALGIGPGDEVIMADTNWIATAAPIVHLGARPVFVDILPDTWCIDPELAEAAITPRTKAIIAVHLYGNLCDMDRLLAIGARHGIPVIEDAAEAIGSVWHGRRAGSMGRFGAFSFHGTKTLTTGEGGMFVTSNDALYEHVLTLTNHGRARGQTKQFWADMVGFKYKMSNVQAAIGCVQLERVDELVARKRQIMQAYRDAFAAIPEIAMNPEPPGTVNGSWMPTVVFDQSTGLTREQLLEAFRAENIDGRVFFWPLSGLPIFGGRPINPIADDTARRAINLPSFHEAAAESLDRIAAVVAGFF